MKRFIVHFLFIINLGFSQTDPVFDSTYVFFTVGIHGGEDTSNYVVSTNNTDLIDQCQEQLALPVNERFLHINGFLDYGDNGFNQPWSWHIIPNEWVLAEMSIGTCNGEPEDVESNLDYWIGTVGQLCNWGSFIKEEIETDQNIDLMVIHVSTTGSDSTGDGSEENPFATIQTAIDSSSDGDTVLVAAGSYCDTINFVGKNIVVASHFIIDQDEAFVDSTILGITYDNYFNGDCADFFDGIKFINGEDSSAVLTGFTITSTFGRSPIQCIDSSPTLSYLTLRDNYTNDDGGGAIYLVNSNSNLENLIIKDNSKGSHNYGGAGIFVENSFISINNSLIANNFSSSPPHNDDTLTGGIVAMNSILELYNNTFYGNSGEFYGGAIHFDTSSSGTITNSIFWENEGPEEITGEATITYSIVQDGWDGEGNIDANPLFCDPDSGDYTLAGNSPCLGAGENGSNMGAFGVGCGIQVDWNFSLSEPVIEVMGTDNVWNPGDTISVEMDFCNNTDVAHNWYPGVTIESDSSLTSLHIGHIWFYAMFADECHAISWGTIANTSLISDTIVEFRAYPEALNCHNQPEYCINGDTLTFEVQIVAQVISAKTEPFTPEEFSLHQNYPNPFNPVTTLRYDIPENSHVTITIYDMLGREVNTLINQTQDAGYRSVIWEATNNYGKTVSAGIYIYQIQAGEYISTKKMVLLK